MPNTPIITTARLILRPFTENDKEAFFTFMQDEKVNTFLPVFPLKTLREASTFLQDNYLNTYQEPMGFRYAVCLQADHIPIGYVNAGGPDSYDFGYALRQDFWHQGIITEAAAAVVEVLRVAGLPYITATHDVNNPRSGAVMKRLGMTYRYSYEEQWQPKNFPVTFRMYQLSFGGRDDTHMKYWDMYPVHFVEEIS